MSEIEQDFGEALPGECSPDPERCSHWPALHQHFNEVVKLKNCFVNVRAFQIQAEERERVLEERIVELEKEIKRALLR